MNVFYRYSLIVLFGIVKRLNKPTSHFHFSILHVDLPDLLSSYCFGSFLFGGCVEYFQQRWVYIAICSMMIVVDLQNRCHWRRYIYSFHFFLDDVEHPWLQLTKLIILSKVGSSTNEDHFYLQSIHRLRKTADDSNRKKVRGNHYSLQHFWFLHFLHRPCKI